jgi:hypothetical protein
MFGDGVRCNSSLETREPCRTGNVVDDDETCVEHGERSVAGCSVGDVKSRCHTDHSEKTNRKVCARTLCKMLEVQAQ